MCQSISEATKFLEKSYSIINKKLFDSALPTAVITIQSSPKAYGHFTTDDVWKVDENGFHEINLGAETLNRPIENTLATLIHEMVHFYCFCNQIKDTSRKGRYHNKFFKYEAEKRLLHIDYDKSIGWSVTSPAEGLSDFIDKNKLRFGLDLFRSSPFGKSKVKKPSSTRKYICPACGMSVRATKDVNVLCIDCGVQMEKLAP